MKYATVPSNPLSPNSQVPAGMSTTFPLPPLQPSLISPANTPPISVTPQSSPTDPESTPAPPIGSYILSLDGFTAFLLSTENSAFSDQHGNIWHDMSRPLSEYYISTSHNTYLVGHQLVGVSTIEGYIRALLRSCRSVEREFFL